LEALYAPQPAKLLALVGEADGFLGPPGNEVAAGQFYNALARLADRTGLAEVRDELRDRALLALAGKLRQASGGGRANTVPTLLGESGAWAAPTVSRARFAVHAAKERPTPREQSGHGVTWLRLGGAVTATCAAARRGAVFLGFADGAVVCFDPCRNRVETVGQVQGLPVAAVATDPEGEVVVMLHG